MRQVKIFLIGVLIFVLGNIPISFAQTETKNLQTVTLSVPTMTCPVCPITVKKALEKVPGVSKVNTDLKGKTVEIIYDPQKIIVKELIRVTTQAGYPSSELQ